MKGKCAWWLAAWAGMGLGIVACGSSGSETGIVAPANDAGLGGAGGAAGASASGGSAGAAGQGGNAGSPIAGSAGSGGGLHTLGGTLAGLSGDKLILQNNGGDDLTLDANGSFVFATKLPQDAAYAVTVSVQPSGQLCLVDHASGSMGASDITSVVVTCSGSGPFSIGGNVGGLMGTGLVLQNNGGDDLPVSQSGPFAFAAKVDAGQPYDVTVLTQPTNPDQTCKVTGGSGTAQADVTGVFISCSLKDTDDDGVPDLSDPFPNDNTKPVTAKPNTVYAHTSSQLFTMDVATHAIALVGSFGGSGYAGSMTDIALDEYGVLWGVTFDDLYVCNAANASCTHLADLPQSFNGLTMVPRGTLDPVQDALVGIANAGDWYRVKVTGAAQAQLTKIGAYGGSYTNAGDVFSIEGVGTFGAVNGSGSNRIVRCDPTTGTVQSVLGPTTGYSQVWGLAGWQGAIFAFDAGGDVFSVDPNTAAVQLISSTNHAWWGAGVTTRM